MQQPWQQLWMRTFGSYLERRENLMGRVVGGGGWWIYWIGLGEMEDVTAILRFAMSHCSKMRMSLRLGVGGLDGKIRWDAEGMQCNQEIDKRIEEFEESLK
jgi:hypothetical protein